MTQTFSLHNHSTFSDGSATAEEMVAAAKAVGLREFGLSDHFVVMPDGSTPNWSMKFEDLEKYFQDLRALQEKYGDENFSLRIGLEADYFPETIDILQGVIDKFAPDYVIGAVHYVGDFALDSSPDPWMALTQEQIDDLWHGYWKKYLDMVTNGNDTFNFFAHLDLPKKFNFMPSYDISEEVEACLQAVANNWNKLEINTAGWHKDCAEQYPATWIVDRAKKLGIRMFASADAHATTDVNRDFDKAALLLVQN